MSVPSFEKINYALRPAKNVERKMFCDVFARLARIAPLPTYRYVGFGSIDFRDFSLFHQRLGITDMVSIEGVKRAQKRFRFNRPYSFVRMEWGWSHEVLPTMSWSKRSIVWLDYENLLDDKMLEDLQTMSASLRSGSILVVTVRAEPIEVLDIVDRAHERRLNDLIDRVGSQRVAPSITGRDLGEWGTARVSREIIHQEVANTLLDRNQALPPEKRVEYKQLFHMQYADGAKMLTVGGIFLDEKDSRIVKGTFEDLPFIRSGRRPYKIESPILTLRELRFLDSRLPVQAGKRFPSWLPRREGRRYNKLYRHFPTFGEVYV